ncbi:MAG: indolepyruvate ferredoxin oxidoreductase subunit alpha [Oscillospiraceae bacterium]|nr:indolepyruvate ferredoxin oxidoreductase subunit alpha [Oscillospiraceae bacterium]
MKHLYLGNEAVARGLYEAGVTVVSSYPGTPSTEITEYAATYDEINAEWAPNEKVSMEVAIGAAIGGARAFSAMKHVGLNVAADPLFTVSYTGVNGGLVFAVADDPGMHSSQNEQDSRHYAIGAKIPMLEPCDSKECIEYTKLAYELSEGYDTPVLIRLTTRISHSRSLVELSERQDRPLKKYEKDFKKYVMMPSSARPKHEMVEERTEKLREYAENSGINKIIKGSGRIGIISAGNAYTYAREAMGDEASYLKLGMINPLPIELIKQFAATVDKIYVIEELDPIIEDHCKANGIDVIGKKIFPLTGEYSQSLVRERICGTKPESIDFGEDIPVRPPVMCCGCSHRGLFAAIKKLGVFVSGDIGCYTLAALPPLTTMDTCVCMGASVSALHGYNLARGKDASKKAVAVLGDSTFVHSGITGLINVMYNKTDSKVIVLDNHTTGMTGGQDNPMSGNTLKQGPAPKIDIEMMARSIGITNIVIVDPYDLTSTYETIKAELNKDGPSLIVARRPCMLAGRVKPNPALSIDKDACKKCGACLVIGCPAISKGKDKSMSIDQSLCVGCGVCAHTCKFGAIV